MTVRLYVWFLLTLGLLLGGEWVVFEATSAHEWRDHAHETAKTNIALVRDLAETLLAHGAPPDEVERRLAAWTSSHHAAVRVERPDGTILFSVGENPQEPTSEERAQLSAIGSVNDFRPEHKVRVLLPIRVAAQFGTFLFTAAPPFGGEPRLPLRAVLSALTVLGLGWLFCWPLARSLAGPLTQVATTAERFGQGDLQARINVKRGDEIGRLATAFNLMADRVAALVTGRQRLLADVSHELRTPLARLRVAVELARDKVGPDTFKRMERQCVAIDGLIEELLTYSRLDLAPYDLHATEHELGAVIADAVEHAGDRVQWAGGAVATLPLDERLFMRALGNVLGNALVHTPEGKSVYVSTHTTEAHLEVIVDDEGPGVAPESYARIFEPFFREKRDGNGYGLGLAITRRCMMAHGGEAKAMASPRGGLRVVLSLPRPGNGAHPHAGVAGANDVELSRSRAG